MNHPDIGDRTRVRQELRHTSERSGAAHRRRHYSTHAPSRATASTPATLTLNEIARWWGFAPEKSITSHSETVSAAIWRVQHPSVYELQGHADENTNLISMPLTGRPHHTYFGDGRQKWSRAHPPFHMSMVVAGERPREIFVCEQPFTYLHVCVPHALIKQLAVECRATKAGADVTLVDPMCSHDPHVEMVCRKIKREMSHPDRCSRLAIDLLGEELAIRLFRQHSNLSGSMFATTRGPGYRDWRLRRAIEYLETHLGDDLRLNEVAAVAGLSTTHLTSLFRAGTGESPHRWLMRRRFERACELLENPSASIADVAHQCGFASSQHLATVMRKRLATTPTAYRHELLGCAHSGHADALGETDSGSQEPRPAARRH